MKELNKVDFHADGSFDMKMRNGTITVPAEDGCYVLSTGCGSGKTECAKSLIRQKHSDGILYCVDTIVEQEKMYSWIMANLNDLGLQESDVIIINSDSKYQNQLAEYRNNPELLMNKQIVLITHVRFWTDLINFFIIYNPKSQVGAFDGKFDVLMKRGDLRKYIIFDETPLFIQPFFSLSGPILGCFSNMDDNGEWKCRGKAEILEYYDKFIKDDKYNPFPKPGLKMNDIKRSVIFDMIPRYFPQWINASGNLNITFTPLDLCQQCVNTHIMILEGAGNVLFGNSTYYKVLDIKDKYNCKVKFESYKFDLRRREETIDIEAYNSFIEWVIARLRQNQKDGKKTLVVVWKNHGKGNQEGSDFYDTVVKNLNKSRISKDSYKVIYYGSPSSKSTNEFRDYNEIILGGVWNITNSDTANFNKHFGTQIMNVNQKLWAFIQLLCRIGIRQHDSKDYTVCYSSDFSSIFIKELKAYFENKDISNRLDVDAEKCPDWLDEKMANQKINKNHKAEILSLADCREYIMEALRRDHPCQVDISLDDISNIIHRSRKKKVEYKNLVKAMKSLGVELNIISK